MIQKTVGKYFVPILMLSASARLATADAIPMMGGGQVGMGNAAMKHLDITFDGATLDVRIDDSVATPWLRPLPEGERFSDSAPWSVLQNKDYNFQYGWNAGGFVSLPPGSGIWVEQIRMTPGLEVYSRPPANPAWTPILGTDGSSIRWKWTGAMTHNAYAVLDPALDEYRAEYEVYLGDATSGAPLGQYQADRVILTLRAEPVRLPGDFNGDGVLTDADIDILGDAIRMSSDQPIYDVDGDGTVNQDDHLSWVHELTHTWLGDANLDGEFNTTDLVTVFQAGKYETVDPAGWAEGDWSADARFGSSDLVAAFQDGGFEQGPRSSVSAVPEPKSPILMLIGLMCVVLQRRR